VFFVQSRRKYFLFSFCQIFLGLFLANGTMLTMPCIYNYVLSQCIGKYFLLLGLCRVLWDMVLGYVDFDNFGFSAISLEIR